MRLIQLFRVLLPSWNFFDRAEAVPSLWVQAQGDWIDRLPAGPSRGWSRLLFNARENERLAAFSLLSQFVDEPDNEVSLELVTRLALQGLSHDPEPEALRGSAELRFKVVYDGSDVHLSERLRRPS